MSWHQTIVVGNLGQDPQFNYLPSGTAVCNFSLAVNEAWNDRQSNERREKTTWYRVAVYGRQAETVNQYLRKGSQVMVIGNVEVRAYTNNAGEPAASLDLRAREVRFLGGRAEGGGQQGGGNTNYDSGGGYDSETPTTVDDIPF